MRPASHQPQTPEQQLLAAIERAAQSRREGADLRVVAEGYRLDTHAPVYFVPSQSNPDQWHRVTQVGKRLSCDCFAGQRGGIICVHRTVTHLYLKGKAQRVRAS